MRGFSRFVTHPVMYGMAAAVLAFGCTEGDDPTAPSLGPPLAFTFSPQYSMHGAADALPVHRARLVARDPVDGAEIRTRTFELDPEEDAWDIRFEIPADRELRSIVVTIELLNVAGDVEAVVWSGRAGPFDLGEQREVVSPDVEFFRGPLSNLSVTRIEIVQPLPTLREGETAALEVIVEGAEEDATVFWHTLDGELATVDADGVVEALLPGPVGIVAFAGPRADTVELGIGRRSATLLLDQENLALSAIGAEFSLVATSLDPRGDPVEDEEFLWSVDDEAVLLSLEDGAFRTLTNGTATVTATAVGAPDVEASATVVVEQVAAEILPVAGDAQTASIDGVVRDAPSVLVVDEAGAPVSGVAVDFAVSEGGGSLSGTTGVTDDAGVALLDGFWTLGPLPGANVLAATIPGVDAPASFTATGIEMRTLSWFEAADGSWSDPLGWTGGRVPAAEDTVLITIDGSFAVTLDEDVAVGALAVGGGAGTATLSGSGVALSVDDALAVEASGTLTLGASTVSAGRLLTNRGTLTIIDTQVNGNLTNEGLLVTGGDSHVEGTFQNTADAQGEAAVLRVDGTEAPALLFLYGFDNGGVIELDGEQATLTIGELPLVNSGTLRMVGAGSYRLEAGLENPGSFEAAGGTTELALSFGSSNSGTIAVTGGDVDLLLPTEQTTFLNGGGTISIAAGRTMTVPGGILSQEEGIIDGAGTLALIGAVLEGTPTTVEGTLALRGATVETALLNRGTVRVEPGRTMIADFHNSAASEGATGTLELIGDAGPAELLSFSSFTNGGVIVLDGVDGTLMDLVELGFVNLAEGAVRTSGAGEYTVSGRLDNQGQILAGGGTLLFMNGSQTNAGLMVAASGGEIVFDNSQGGEFLNQGLLDIGGIGVVHALGGTFVNDQDAQISGPGELFLEDNFLDNRGVLNPGMTSMPRIEGDYLESASARIVIGLLGEDNFVPLHITGFADFAGMLEVHLLGGFQPEPETAFEVITYGGVERTLQLVETVVGDATFSLIAGPNSTAIVADP